MRGSSRSDCGCYYRDGSPMGRLAFACGDFERLKRDQRYIRVARTQLNRSTAVSTVWIGFDASTSDNGPPLIFETALIVNMTTPGDLTTGDFVMFLKASTEREARETHEVMYLTGLLRLGYYSNGYKYWTRKKRTRMMRRLRQCARLGAARRRMFL